MNELAQSTNELKHSTNQLPSDLILRRGSTRAPAETVAISTVISKVGRATVEVTVDIATVAVRPIRSYRSALLSFPASSAIFK
jgi:hypothetical protein